MVANIENSIIMILRITVAINWRNKVMPKKVEEKMVCEKCEGYA
jgi:hypothetical protein